MAEKLTKRQLKHDKFIDWIYGAWAYAQDNVTAVLGGAVVVIVLVVLGVWVGGSRVSGGPKAGDREAERALTTAREQFGAGQPEAAVATLDDLRDRRGKSRAAREGTYILGNVLFQSGDYAGAEKAFRDFLQRPLHGDLLRDGARLGIAASLEEQGNLDAASAEYLTLWTSGIQPGTRLQGGLGAARCALAQGAPERAADLYQQVADAFPDAPEGQDARFRALELRGGHSAG